MNLSGGLEERWVTDPPILSQSLLCLFEGLKFSSREPGELKLEEELGAASCSCKDIGCPRDTDSGWLLTSCCISGWHEQKESWTPRCLHFYTSYVGSGMDEGTRIASLVILARKRYQKSCCRIVHFHMVEGLEKLFKFCATACPASSLGIEHRASLQTSQNMPAKGLTWWKTHVSHSVNSPHCHHHHCHQHEHQHHLYHIIDTSPNQTWN